MRLGDARCDGADARLAHQLHADPRPRVDLLQVIDELREILDRVDVVVRRRRDEADARHRVAQEADVLGDFVAGQLAALAGLRALRHLDLDLVGVDQVLDGDAETARRDLFDRRTQAVAFLQLVVALDAALADDVGHHLAALHRLEARRVLAAFAGVRLAADTVHGDRQRAVRLGRDRAERHGAGSEALDDFLGRLDFIKRHGGAGGLDLEQAAQRHVALRLVVDDPGVFLEGLVLARTRRVLQLGDRVRRPHVLFAAHAEGVFAAGIEPVGEHGVVAEGLPVQADGFFHDFEDTDAFHLRRSAGEVLVDQRLLQADGFEDLRAGVGHVGRDAHLRHDLEQALADALDEVLDGLLAGLGVARQLLQAFQREVGMHGLGAVAGEHGEVVRFAGAAGFDDETDARAQPLGNEVLMHRRSGEQRRNGHVFGVDLAIRHDKDAAAGMHGIFRFMAQRGQTCFDPLVAPGQRIADVEFGRLELVAGVGRDVAQLRHVGVGQHRLRDFQAVGRVDLVDAEQVGLRSDEGHQRHDELLADRVDRRVGDLREKLAEVVEQLLVLRRQHGERRIVAHRAGRFLARLGHRLEDELDVFLAVAKGLLAVEQCGRALGRGGVRRRLEPVELDVDARQPVLVGLLARQGFLQFKIVDDAALVEVDQEHLARLQTPLLDDLRVGNRQHAGFRGHHHEVVVGHEIARRAQAVAVERGADLAAVGEGHGGRTVPRLDHRGVVFVEGAALVVHQRVRFPGFGNHHHHRVGERVAAHHQQFERVVEGGGVGLARIDQRPDFFQVGAEQRRRGALFARAHPVVVAAQRVDLAVVRDHAERVGELPGREGVGRETLVHQGKGRDAARVLEVDEVLADLVGQQQALVDDGARRHRRLVELLAVLETERLDGVRGTAADDVQLALERVGDHDVGAAADEDLTDHRFLGAHRRRHRQVAVDRDVAPAENNLAFGTHGAFDLFLTGQARSRFLRQKDHADAVVAGLRQGDALLRHFLAQVGVWNLDQDTGPVAHQRVGADGAPVIQVFQDLQALFDDRVALLPLDVCDKTDTAGVVLVGRVVKPLPFRYSRIHHARILKKTMTSYELIDTPNVKKAGALPAYEFNGRLVNIQRKT